MPTFWSLMGVNSPFDPTARFATSWLLPPSALAAVRLLFALYAFVTQIVVYALSGAVSDRQSFSYFTVLTYWGLAFYLLVAGLHSLSYARSGFAREYWLQWWPRALQAAHSFFYTTVVVFPFIVTVVYWTILYRPPFFPVLFDAWANVRGSQFLKPSLRRESQRADCSVPQISRHGLNSFFALFELLIPRTAPPPALHLLFLIILLALYLGLAYLTHTTQGFYVYSFLDPGQGAGKTAGYIIGILGGACIVFGLAVLVISIRDRLTDAHGRKGKYRDMEMQAR